MSSWNQGIITPVEEPTDWVSSLAYSWKANGKLRVCLDPRDVNKAIKRDHYKTPTVEEITCQLAGSKKFIKVDGTSSYLCIVLDYESSPSHHIQHTMGKVQICTTPLGPIMCPGYLPKNDGPDTGMVQGSYWNC